MPPSSHPLAPIVSAAGLAGAVLTLLGDTSPYTGLLTLVFLLTSPALTVWPLLPRLSPPARVVASGAVTIVVNVAVAQAMLSLGLWSIRGGVAVVLAICLLAAPLGVVVSRRPGRAASHEASEEDWMYEG